jgi:hypothetical protein
MANNTEVCEMKCWILECLSLQESGAGTEDMGTIPVRGKRMHSAHVPFMTSAQVPFMTSAHVPIMKSVDLLIADILNSQYVTGHDSLNRNI